MRNRLLATSAIAALGFLADLVADTVADDYGAASVGSGARTPTENRSGGGQDSLRVRLLAQDRMQKDHRRAVAAQRAAAGRDFVHRRNRDAI